jgi:hypothetical protein
VIWVGFVLTAVVIASCGGAVWWLDRRKEREEEKDFERFMKIITDAEKAMGCTCWYEHHPDEPDKRPVPCEVHGAENRWIQK